MKTKKRVLARSLLLKMVNPLPSVPWQREWRKRLGRWWSFFQRIKARARKEVHEHLSFYLFVLFSILLGIYAFWAYTFSLL